MKDANSAPNWMRFAYKAIKDFGSDQVVDLEDLDDLEEIDDALESALDDPSGLDCERFGRGELTYGQFISTLLLCRDLETTSIDPFRPRSVTVIRSPLSFPLQSPARPLSGGSLSHRGRWLSIWPKRHGGVCS